MLILCINIVISYCKTDYYSETLSKRHQNTRQKYYFFLIWPNILTKSYKKCILPFFLSTNHTLLIYIRVRPLQTSNSLEQGDIRCQRVYSSLFLCITHHLPHARQITPSNCYFLSVKNKILEKFYFYFCSILPNRSYTIPCIWTYKMRHKIPFA